MISDAVQLELIKAVPPTIGAIASIVAAVIGWMNHRTANNIKTQNAAIHLAVKHVADKVTQ